MKFLITLFLLATSLLSLGDVPPTVHEVRVWTSNKGTTVKGRLVSVDNDSVIIQSDVGKNIKVLTKQLSAKDRKYVNLIKMRSQPLVIAFDRDMGASGIYTGGARPHLKHLGEMKKLKMVVYKDDDRRVSFGIDNIIDVFNKHPEGKRFVVMCAGVQTLATKSDQDSIRKSFLSRVRKWETYAKTNDVVLLMIHPTGINTPYEYKKKSGDTKKVKVTPEQGDSIVRGYIDRLDGWKIIPVNEVRAACFGLDPIWKKAWDGGHCPSFMTEMVIFSVIMGEVPSLTQFKKYDHSLGAKKSYPNRYQNLQNIPDAMLEALGRSVGKILAGNNRYKVGP